MNRNTHTLPCLVLALAAFTGCSSEPAKETKKAVTLDKIQGRAQVVEDPAATDAALNGGGPTIYIWEGVRQYRLFLKTKVEVEKDKQYIAEGVYAQKAIDEIGDPAQGKNGYPLEASCLRVVHMAWSGLPFDLADGHASALRARIKRYPARPVFLVTRIMPAPEKEAKAGDKGDEDAPEVSVPGEKQSALKVEGPTTQPAPLWEPGGGTAKCKVEIGTDGKISALETGAQLCEAVPWSQFKYQPTVQKGKPVKVKTEVEVQFEARK